MKLKGEYKKAPTEKKCARCLDVKPCNIKFFYRQENSATGWSSWCLDCHRQANRKYKNGKRN